MDHSCRRRADVINLLRAGFDNAIAIEGAKIDETVTKLTEGKKVIAFLDGDRAGDLILKELHGLVKIDKAPRAPVGREVEELTPVEITEILKEAIGLTDIDRQQAMEGQQAQLFQQQAGRKLAQKDNGQEETEEEQTPRGPSYNATVTQEENPDIILAIKNIYSQINETLEAVILDNSLKILLKVPVSEVVKKLGKPKEPKILILDGIVTQRLVDGADRAGIEYIVGHRTGEVKRSSDLRIRTYGDMGISN